MWIENWWLLYCFRKKIFIYHFWLIFIDALRTLLVVLATKFHFTCDLCWSQAETRRGDSECHGLVSSQTASSLITENTLWGGSTKHTAQHTANVKSQTS